MLLPEGIFTIGPISILLVVACVVMKVVSFLLQRRLDNDGNGQVDDNSCNQQGERDSRTSCTNSDTKNECSSEAKTCFSFHQKQPPTFSETPKFSTSWSSQPSRKRRGGAPSSTST